MNETPDHTTWLSSAAPYRLETKADKIDYIIEKLTGIPSLQSLSDVLEEAQDDDYLEEIRDERNSLWDKLNKLPDKQFDHRFDEIRQAVKNDVARICKLDDASTFALWIEKDAWLPREALCLWLGLDPRFGAQLIAWAHKNRGLAVAAVEILERWELINRSTWVGALSPPFRPKLFAQWANAKRKLPNHFAEWLAHVTPNAARESIDRELEKELAEQRAEVERLSRNLTEINYPHYKLSVKLFAALCAGVYGYDRDKRNEATRLVADIV
ncbi:hypothetical protein U8607_10695 [Methylobacterium durans]|uniref:hypothetical protein n=1 Tax=Methylobacterium durans TaxID=2202825 RepID=UPI002AFE7B3B|nr:hypothetical protein [Methylobacterium durans]MEA1832550.1 hypothetical protein [Methylobacterium durans]